MRLPGHNPAGTGSKRCRLLLLAIATSSAHAQLNQNCTVSVLNRTVQVNADSSWVLPNIPANFGQVKAHATCVQNGVTTFGESAFFTISANTATNLPAITLGTTTPIPSSLTLTPAAPSLTTPGQTVQLAVTATYADNSTKDVTPTASGTNYISSNPAIATVSATGLVTAVSSGTALIQASTGRRQCRRHPDFLDPPVRARPHRPQSPLRRPRPRWAHQPSGIQPRHQSHQPRYRWRRPHRWR